MMRAVHLLGACALAAIAMPAIGAPPADDNRTNMMRQLGISALVPGFSGDEAAPDHANYDESKANPYPVLPDPLTLNSGRTVPDARTWAVTRRAEILEQYSREVYGRVPANLPPVRWTVAATDRETIGFRYPVVARRVIGHVENEGDPANGIDMRLMVVLPADAKGPVPVLIMFKYGADGFPEPSQPSAQDYDRINAAIKAMLVRQDPALAPVFQAHQAMSFASAPAFRLPQRDPNGDLPPTDQLIAAGWGYVTFDPTTAQADNSEGLRKGIVGLGNRGAYRKPEDWGALRAWAWAASRVFDYLAADPMVDSKRIGIEGVSRYGKAALVTMAYDDRFAVGLIGSSGKGGATPLRRNFGEGVSNLASGSHYWMAGNFMKYDTKGVSKPGLDAGDLPVDANELIALAAPRPLFISYGIPEQGDAKWLDQKGSYMATLDAGRVYKLLGADGVGSAGPPAMPPVETFIAGRLAWRQHVGGHTDVPNFRYFIPWADKELARPR